MKKIVNTIQCFERIITKFVCSSRKTDSKDVYNFLGLFDSADWYLGLEIPEGEYGGEEYLSYDESHAYTPAYTTPSTTTTTTTTTTTATTTTTTTRF